MSLSTPNIGIVGILPILADVTINEYVFKKYPAELSDDELAYVLHHTEFGVSGTQGDPVIWHFHHPDGRETIKPIDGKLVGDLIDALRYNPTIDKFCNANPVDSVWDYPRQYYWITKFLADSLPYSIHKTSKNVDYYRFWADTNEYLIKQYRDKDGLAVNFDNLYAMKLMARRAYNAAAHKNTSLQPRDWLNLDITHNFECSLRMVLEEGDTIVIPISEENGMAILKSFYGEKILSLRQPDIGVFDPRYQVDGHGLPIQIPNLMDDSSFEKDSQEAVLDYASTFGKSQFNGSIAFVLG